MTYFLKILYYLVLLAGVIALLVRWKKLDKRLYLFLGLLVSVIATELIRDFFYQRVVANPHNNIAAYVVHIYQPVETILLSLYYYLIFETISNRRIVSIGLFLFFVFYAYFYIYQSENFFQGDSIDLVIAGLFYSIYSVLFLVELYKKEEAITLSKYPHFWIVIGNLIFYSSTLFYYALQYYILADAQAYVQLLFIPQVLNLILYSLYLIAFLCKTEVKK
jgi:hypothetical protein